MVLYRNCVQVNIKIRHSIQTKCSLGSRVWCASVHLLRVFAQTCMEFSCSEAQNQSSWQAMGTRRCHDDIITRSRKIQLRMHSNLCHLGEVDQSIIIVRLDADVQCVDLVQISPNIRQTGWNLAIEGHRSLKSHISQTWKQWGLKYITSSTFQKLTLSFLGTLWSL